MLFEFRPPNVLAPSRRPSVSPVLIPLLILAAHAAAQSNTTGAIAGSLTDPLDRRVLSASVTARNGDTSARITTSTNRTGVFLFPALAPGEYTVSIDSPGFRPLVLSGVAVNVGQTLQLTAQLQVAGATTTVDVSADLSGAESLDEGSAATALSSVITPAELQQLPLNGRQWQSFVLLTALANPAAPDDADLISFRGLDPSQNSTRIDGSDDDQGLSGTPRGSGIVTEAQIDDQGDAATESGANRSFAQGSSSGRHAGTTYTFSQEAVREFHVSAAAYSAMYGHAAGAVISTVSRSGSNELHGSAFYNVRSEAFAAADPFSLSTRYRGGLVSSAVVKPHDLRQQFGGSLGGPITAQRIFFFYAYDQQRRSFPAISSPQYAGFYALTPTQFALLANRGVTAARTAAALSYLDGLSGTIDRRRDQTVNFARADWQLSPPHRLSLAYNRARSSSPAGVRLAPVVSRGVASFGSSTVRVDALFGAWSWSRAASLSNELRLQYGRDLQFETPQAPLPQEPATGPGGYAPEIEIAPQGFSFGTPASLGRRAYPDERRIETSDLFTAVRGAHLLQLGADFSALHDSVQSLANTEGTFLYDSGNIGGHAGGLVDWITDFTFNVNAYPNGGCPSINATLHYACFRSFTQSFGQQSVAFNTQEWAAFLQDTWRVRRGLTLGAGLRYEYELLPFPQQPNQSIDTIFGGTGATSVFPEDRNNFGPRASLAWEPLGHGRGVLRAGYGLYFGKLAGATIRTALLDTALPSSTTHIRILPTTITNCPQVANQGFGYPCSFLSTPSSSIASTTSAFVFDRRFRLPALQEATLSLERELGRSFVASATYLFNLDRQLMNSVDINIAPSTSTRAFQLQGGSGAPGVRDGEIFALPLYTQRLSSLFGPVTDILSNSNASYHALALEASRSARNGFDFHLSWTWSKSIDYGSAGAVPRANGLLDPFTNRYDKGLSSLNYPHKVTASVLWQPRLHHGPEALRRAANGWRVASIVNESSGRPYSYNIFGGARLSGGHESINGSGGASYLPTVGRNVLRLPDTLNVDLRLSREISLRESVRLRATAEAFNLTNHLNYSGVVQRAFLAGTASNGITPLVFQNATAIAAEGLNTQPFGTFTAASAGSGAPRQVQFGIRLEF